MGAMAPVPIVRQGWMVLRSQVSLAFAAGVLTTVLVSWATDGLSVRSASAGDELDRVAFQQALDAVFERYVEPVDRSQLLANGLKHMVAELDPHSYYLTADERKALRRQAQGGHTGLAVVMERHAQRGSGLEIAAVLPGSPAEVAGLRPGDAIRRIGEREITGLLGQAEAEALLAGAPGDRISLLVKRAGELPRRVALVLQDKLAESVMARVLVHGDAKVAVLKIRDFRRGTGVLVRNAMADSRRAAGPEGLAGVVLDLRTNPGGEVEEALIVADLFVASGTLTRIRGRNGQIVRVEEAHRAGTDVETPLVVLQDRHTASAAELVAAALQENGRAVLVGESTFGKGTVQEVIGLRDGSVLTMTVARYFSPNDRLIDGIGVRPQVSIGGDASLTTALDLAARGAPLTPDP